jgi:peptidoglycan hydrolase-like protein with peptidoglycan-binding domain
MSSFAALQQGDRLPTVGVIQLLLNRSGSSLKVDGTFGPRTRAAVLEFQRQRGLAWDRGGGTVNKRTWDRLFHSDKLPLIDFVDVFDSVLIEKQAPKIVEAGGSPLYMGGMSNGLSQMSGMLTGAREILLLRLWGHGGPGVQAISMGRGGWAEDTGQRDVSGMKPSKDPTGVLSGPVGRHTVYHLYPHETTSMNSGSLAAVQLSLRGIFGPWGSLELHGCHVAHGPKGHEFVQKLAYLLDVPVTAGIGTQHPGMRFLGPTVTAAPRGRTLAQWCAELPPFTPMSVP